MYNSNENGGSNRLFITQIPRDVDERELMNLFGSFGEVLDAKIIPSQHQSVTCKLRHKKQPDDFNLFRIDKIL
jgi:RNA recognition motif-containing protein